MSRLLLAVIIVVIASLEGLPTENPMSFEYQLVEKHKEEENSQWLASVLDTSTTVDADKITGKDLLLEWQLPTYNTSSILFLGLYKEKSSLLLLIY